MRLGDVCAKGKSSLRQKDLRNDGPYVVFGASGIAGTSASYQNESPYVAVVKDGAGVGRARICQEQSSVLGTMQALIPNERITCKYLLHLVRSMKLGEGFSGSTIPHIYFKDYSEREVVVPALDDQEKITSTLDKIENLIDGEKTTITHLQSLVKSRFVEMFGKELWQKKSIGDLALDIRYGTSKKASNAGKYTYLRMNNITDDGRLDFSDTKKIDLEDDELEKCTARKGDLLFNRTNSREKVGKTAVFMENDPMVIAGYIIRVRLGDEVRSQYLATFMNLPTTKSLLRSISKGAVHQANINSKELASIEVPVPPKEIQDTFAAFAGRAAKLEFVALVQYNNQCRFQFNEGRSHDNRRDKDQGR